MRKAFKKIDSDGDGEISFQELKKAYRKYSSMKGIGLTNDELHDMLNDMDLTGTGSISYSGNFHRSKQVLIS